MSRAKPGASQHETDWPEQLAVRVARCYYELGLTQQEIASELGIGRARVIRLLSEARARGIVTISINSPLLENVEIAEALAARFNLSWAEIVLSYADNEDEQMRNLAFGACETVERYLHNGMTLSVGWGVTLRELAKQLSSAKSKQVTRKGMVVTALLGNLSRRSTVDQFEATTELAASLNADCLYLPGPIICDTREACDVLVAQPDFRRAYQRACASDLALVSIGGMQNATMQRSGIVSPAETEQISASGGVGNFLGYYVDHKGDVLQHEINQRVLGVAQSEFMQIKQRVMISAGSSKVAALKAVLSKGLLTALVTDQVTARLLLNETEDTVCGGSSASQPPLDPVLVD